MNTQLESTSPHYATVKQLLINFIASNDTDKKKLLKGLKAVEKIVKVEIKAGGQSTKKKELWLRFFGSDTGATGIMDIDRGLDNQCTSQNNIKYMLECMDIAIEENSSMELHFS